VNIVLDLGGGALGALQKYLALSEVDAVFITHPHTDHFADLYPMSIASYYGRKLGPGLPLFGTPEFLGRVGGILGEGTREAWGYCFDERPIPPGSVAEASPFRIGAFEMNHTAGSVGFRLESDGVTLAYTGDTAPCDAASEMAAGVDLFVCDATWQDGHEGAFHMTARQAGEAASRAGARALLLTHLEPGTDPDASRVHAGESFSGPIHVAEPGKRLVVGEA
jgi:ribonuclease BN (tRNA processing enzyme)